MDIEEQYDKIYRYCYFKLYDTQLAQDITQETFLRFYRQGLTLDNDKELPYLYMKLHDVRFHHRGDDQNTLTLLAHFQEPSPKPSAPFS